MIYLAIFYLVPEVFFGGVVVYFRTNYFLSTLEFTTFTLLSDMTMYIWVPYFGPSLGFKLSEIYLPEMMYTYSVLVKIESKLGEYTIKYNFSTVT